MVGDLDALGRPGEVRDSVKVAFVVPRYGPDIRGGERSGAGLCFGDFAEFEAALELLTADDAALYDVMRANGLRDVDANHRWPVILDRYGAFLARLADGNGNAAAPERDSERRDLER